MDTSHQRVVSIIRDSYLDELKDVLASDIEEEDVVEFIVELVNDVTREVKQEAYRDGIL